MRPSGAAQEVALAVLAATLTSSVVFFPVMFLYGVSRFLFSALALAVVLSLFASYFVALTVVPLFCAKLIKGAPSRRRRGASRAGGSDSTTDSIGGSPACSKPTSAASASRSSVRRWSSSRSARCLSSSLVLYPLLGVAFFPRTDAGQFVINLKSPSGSRIEVTTADVAKVEALVRRIVDPKELDLITAEHRRDA